MNDRSSLFTLCEWDRASLKRVTPVTPRMYACFNDSLDNASY